jgi:microcystin-dependent protein
MASPDKFNPLVPIPNDPFGYPVTWDFYAPPSPITFSSGFTIDPTTGVVTVTQLPPPIIGTVTSVTAGVGIRTFPVTGITVSGSVSLAPAPASLNPGSYTYANVTLDQYGKLTNAQSGTQPLYSALGYYPISVTGSAPTLNVSVATATTSQLGATQLADDLITQSSTEALTANQGYILNRDLSNIPIDPVNGQYYAGAFSPVTQKILTVSYLGQANGYQVGQPLPLPGGPATEGFLIAAAAGNYTPPGGMPAGSVLPYYEVKPGDEFYCSSTLWIHIPKGFRYPYATTTSAGIVQLAKQTDIRPFTNNTLVCTPFSLANLTATTTERGWILISTDAECQALLTPLKAVTPANLSATPSTVFTRGIIQLSSSTTSTSITQGVTAAALNSVYISAILKSQITATGDLIAGEAAATPGTLSKGTNQYVLTADDLAPQGMSWRAWNPPQPCPVGTVMWFASSQVSKLPATWAFCDGGSASALPEISPGVPNPYYELFQVIGYTFGGSGATFNLPDMRGKFNRGWSGSGGTAGSIDNPRTFGSTQASDVRTHTHNWNNFTHSHNPIIVSDPSHNHQMRAATVIGPNNGYFGNKDTGPDPASDGTNGASISMSTSPALTGTYTSLTNTAPTPVDQTRPVNFPMVPIIRYTYGSNPPPATPAPKFYFVSATPTSLGTSSSTNVTVLTANVPRGTVLYWKLDGPGIDPSLFSPAALTGTTVVGQGNVATFTITTAASFPVPPYSVGIEIYSDSTYLDRVGNIVYLTLT